MELTERLVHHAELCEATCKAMGFTEDRYPAQWSACMREAASLLQAYRGDVAANGRTIDSLRSQVNSLTEQLLIAKTAASDTDSFRERDKRDAANLMAGLRMAIHTMAEALKGVQR